MQAHRIKGLRKAMGWTRVELAKRSGLSSEQIKNLEESDRLLSEAEIQALERAFGFQALEEDKTPAPVVPSTKSNVASLLEHLPEGQRLKALRERRDLTRKELALEMGISWTQISEWENSSKPLPQATLNTLATALGCRVDELSSRATGTGEAKAPEAPSAPTQQNSQSPSRIPEESPSLEEAVTRLSASEQSALLTLLGSVDKTRDPLKAELNALFDRMSERQKQALVEHIRAMLG